MEKAIELLRTLAQAMMDWLSMSVIVPFTSLEVPNYTLPIAVVIVAVVTIWMYVLSGQVRTRQDGATYTGLLVFYFLFLFIALIIIMLTGVVSISGAQFA